MNYVSYEAQDWLALEKRLLDESQKRDDQAEQMRQIRRAFKRTAASRVS